MTRLTGGELVVQMLDSLEIQHIFGVPGGQTLGIMDALKKQNRIEFITVRHEGAAAAMADAYGRLTRRPGVCLATTGPGATNLLTGIGGALRDSSPVLVLTCNNNSADIGKDDAQNADHVALFKPLTKSSRMIANVAAIPQAIEEAYLQAILGNPGPVHIDFTRDAIETDANYYTTDSPHPLLTWVHQRPRGDVTLLKTAIRKIERAKHPLLWLGSGISRSQAGPMALKFAETLTIPIITTFNGIGTVPSQHPLVFGVQSRMGTALSSHILSESDLIIAAGNGLNAISTGRWRLDLPELIQINIDPMTLGRYYTSTTSLGIIGDAQAVFEDLLNVYGEYNRKRTPDAEAVVAERKHWLTELETLKYQWWNHGKPRGNESTGKGFAPWEIVSRVREVAPDDTLLIADAGNAGIWSYYWETRQHDSYLKPVGFGNMGFGVPAAIAAAVLNPRRPVLVLIGDGALGMTLAELETLARIGGRVCIIVLNDAGYGNIRQEQEIKYDRRTIGVDYSDSDYASIAERLGVRGQRLETIESVVSTVKHVLTESSEPYLIDLKIDPSVNVWTFSPFLPHDVEEG